MASRAGLWATLSSELPQTTMVVVPSPIITAAERPDSGQLQASHCSSQSTSTEQPSGTAAMSLPYPATVAVLALAGSPIVSPAAALLPSRPPIGRSTQPTLLLAQLV